MTKPKIELVYFGGCPHVEGARKRLGEALEQAGQPGEWKEWEMDDPEIPEEYRSYGSPTVLVEGRPVGEGGAPARGRACRADGGPSTDTIRRALRGRS